ncbi:MAG: glycosyltransferase [Planctomycetota bacterium]|nr:glycosyltransferase [Planctomycetota bacterium]
MTSSHSSIKSPARPRVAVVYHFFAHYREPIVERLARSEVADFVFFGDDHDYESSIKAATFSKEVKFRFCPTKKIFRSVMWQSGVLRLSFSDQFDQIIFLGNPFWLATWVAAIVARLMGKRVLFWSHGFLSPPQGVKGMIRRMFFCLAHTHLFYGRWAKQHAISLGWDPKNLHVVANSLHFESQSSQRRKVTAEEVAELRKSLFRDPSLPVAFCSCRLQSSKRLDLLISALALLRTDGVAVNALIVGDGPCRSDLEKLARDSSIDAHFTGACYDDALLALYISASNITVSPGFVGLTAIHSMTFGVPVISHSTMGKQAPEVEAIIPGITGNFFTLGDVADLARVIGLWLSRNKGRAETSAACIAIVERFWSPTFQQEAIERAVMGYPADDLFFLRSKNMRSLGE